MMENQAITEIKNALSAIHPFGERFVQSLFFEEKLADVLDERMEGFEKLQKELSAFADAVLVPVDCGFYALEGLSALTATMSTIKKGLNKDLDIEGVLLTMFDGRTNLSIQIAQEVKRFFPGKVFSTAIPRNVRLAEAPSHGKPINEYDRFSKGAECYALLAQEIVAKNQNETGAKQ